MFFIYLSWVTKGINKGKVFNTKRFNRTKILFAFLVVVQWNLITYIFPSREFWAYDSLFWIVMVFFFDKKLVKYVALAILVSIGVSWYLLPDKLLPIHDSNYGENLILRLTLLVLGSYLIYLTAKIGESFKKSIEKSNNQLRDANKELQTLNDDIVDFTAMIVGVKDHDSGVHINKVKEYTRILTRQVMNDYPEYGIDERVFNLIVTTSVLHDVGKIKISDTILTKPGKLDKSEFDSIKDHTIVGAEVIDGLPNSVNNTLAIIAREICLSHHERYDGSGYQQGLKGEEIPVSAQIVGIADCYDALTAQRPYKDPITPEAAYHMIINGECGAFSEKMLDSFTKCFEELVKINAQ